MSEPVCSQCGLCCQLFLINLSEVEYRSREYQTIFSDLALFEDFDAAASCGANILGQHTDGSCIYLAEGKCSIHERRPQVCRNFFCKGNEPEFAQMRKDIEEARNGG